MATSKRDTHISHMGLTSEGCKDPPVISSRRSVHQDHRGEQPQADMGEIAAEASEDNYSAPVQSEANFEVVDIAASGVVSPQRAAR
mmetsp:Transcript_9413/g.19131  ORF Transcript_9413/g.19131 Transcript_9413/m.19131 type:complete len:86 (+) Transcript_9413:40-297(+)